MASAVPRYYVTKVSLDAPQTLLRADCCYARRSATPLQQLEGFKREATIVSAELDDEAAVIISCPREGGGGPVQSRRRAPDDKYSPHSQTPELATRIDGRAQNLGIAETQCIRLSDDGRGAALGGRLPLGDTAAGLRARCRLPSRCSGELSSPRPSPLSLPARPPAHAPTFPGTDS